MPIWMICIYLWYKSSSMYHAAINAFVYIAAYIHIVTYTLSIPPANRACTHLEPVNAVRCQAASFLKCESYPLLQLIGIAALIIRQPAYNRSVEGRGCRIWAMFRVYSRGYKKIIAFSFFVKPGCTIWFILTISSHLLLVPDWFSVHIF